MKMDVAQLKRLALSWIGGAHQVFALRVYLIAFSQEGTFSGKYIQGDGPRRGGIHD